MPQQAIVLLIFPKSNMALNLDFCANNTLTQRGRQQQQAGGEGEARAAGGADNKQTKYAKVHARRDMLTRQEKSQKNCTTWEQQKKEEREKKKKQQ